MFGRYFTGHLLGLAYQLTLADVSREYHRRGLRSADYTVIAALGLGDGITRDEVIARAARGGVDLPQHAIDRLVENNTIVQQDTLRLSDGGRRLLAELVAVAQTTQLRLEQILSAHEMALLHDLLNRLTVGLAERGEAAAQS